MKRLKGRNTVPKVSLTPFERMEAVAPVRGNVRVVYPPDRVERVVQAYNQWYDPTDRAGPVPAFLDPYPPVTVAPQQKQQPTLAEAQAAAPEGNTITANIAGMYSSLSVMLLNKQYPEPYPLSLYIGRMTPHPLCCGVFVLGGQTFINLNEYPNLVLTKEDYKEMAQKVTAQLDLVYPGKAIQLENVFYKSSLTGGESYTTHITLPKLYREALLECGWEKTNTFVNSNHGNVIELWFYQTEYSRKLLADNNLLEVIKNA